MKRTSSEKNTEARKVGNFVWVGIVLTIIDYVVYELLVMLFWRGNTETVAIASVISGIIATIVAYLMHSQITWRARDPGKYGVVKFFAWNIVAVTLIRPTLALGFGLLTGLYQFALMIFEWLHIPFSYDFVESTGIFVLMMAVMMVLNFLAYEKLVFTRERGKSVNIKSVRKAGEKE